ncbi:hypothetical protein [Paenibacillus antarcticus]|uniref:hypothetical protein n=1 Tax=Paenibacillus antarcticus TaxID=253703 RepID=UPI0014716A22|nr:hypothetical protein [Paenibacillus antarcticus]
MIMGVRCCGSYGTQPGECGDLGHGDTYEGGRQAGGTDKYGTLSAACRIRGMLSGIRRSSAHK